MRLMFGSEIEQTVPGTPARTPSGFFARPIGTYVLPILIGIGGISIGAIGTGGAFTREYVHARQAKLLFSHDADANLVASVDDIAADLNLIRSALKLSVAELANCVGVTRQAVYGWKSGAEIKPENAKKFQGLVSAAAVIASSEVKVSSITLRRVLPGGKTLLEIIGSGGDGELAASTLVALLKTEQIRRHELSARFSKRADSQSSLIEPVPTTLDD